MYLVLKHADQKTNRSIAGKTLRIVLRNENKVLTRKMILENVWNTDAESNTKVVDVYINYLRNKVDREFDQQLIHTVHGLGYAFRCTNK